MYVQIRNIVKLNRNFHIHTQSDKVLTVQVHIDQKYIYKMQY